MANTPRPPATPQQPDAHHPDLLAAVVLHTLVSGGKDGMTLAQVALACERDPTDEEDLQEVEVALEILLADGLAGRQADLWRPTRAAIRAAELSF